MKITTARLLEAAILISQMKGKEVTAIQFEDGSGNKFNYQLDSSGIWEFIDLSRYNLSSVYYHQLDLLDEVRRFTILETTYNNLLNKQK